MTRDELQALLDRAAAGWASGDAAAVGDCFAQDVDYGDPYLYRFDRREDLLPFFEPPPGGHHVTWHTVIWDDEAQTGVVEYTYVGHHRYHGAAIVRPDAEGLIALWREWQHLDDELDWDARLRGPAPISG
jgi:SnoaL-like domain